MIIQFIPNTGAKVQVDCATGWQSLQSQETSPDSILRKYGIKIDLGRPLNKNKNPIAENGIQEFQKERLKIDPRGGPVTPMDIAIITKNMNSRIRYRGYSAKEIVIQRDQISNDNKIMDDQTLSDQQYTARTGKHPIKTKTDEDSFKEGDNVYLKSGKSKLKAREMFKITRLYEEDSEQWASLQKFDSQFRAKSYEAKLAELVLVPKVETDLQLSENSEEKDDDIDSNEGEFEDTENDHSKSKLKRKSALKCSKNIQQLIDSKSLNIQCDKNQHPPKHGWNWDQFKQMLEDEIYFTTLIPQRKRRIFEAINHQNEDENLSVDNDSTEETARSMSHHEHSESLTSTCSEDDVTFINNAEDNIPSVKYFSRNHQNRRGNRFINVSRSMPSSPGKKRSSHIPTMQFFRRNHANSEVNQGQIHSKSLPNSPNKKSSQDGITAPPNSPSEVNLGAVQNLNAILRPRTPIVPDAVQLY